jgi:hypothetical protein
MLLHLTEDEHGWVVVPHSTEPECWDTLPEGSAQIKAAGWKPHVMHRVSRYVVDSLIIDGLLKLAFKVPETTSHLRENHSGLPASEISSAS